MDTWRLMNVFSLQGLPSESPMFTRKQAEEWRECHSFDQIITDIHFSMVSGSCHTGREIGYQSPW